MRSGLLKRTGVYRKDQVDSPEKIHLLWLNLADALSVEEATGQPGQIFVDIQDNLFDDSVAVTFSAYVRKVKK